jgi:hypothetical protein
MRHEAVLHAIRVISGRDHGPATASAVAAFTGLPLREVRMVLVQLAQAGGMSGTGAEAVGDRRAAYAGPMPVAAGSRKAG